jgi:hypothetical protein
MQKTFICFPNECHLNFSQVVSIDLSIASCYAACYEKTNSKGKSVIIITPYAELSA